MSVLGATNTKNCKNRDLCKRVANHCAPVLCRAKISNMITVSKEEANVLTCLCKNTFLSTQCLYEDHQKAVLFIYNRDAVSQHMKMDENQEFILNRGYHSQCMETMINEVSRRFTAYMRNQEEFPHELGVLLGYPIWDVVGFIENKGENSLFTGYWKVYNELANAIVTFHRFDRAKKEINKLVEMGQTLEHIITYYHNLSFQAR